jgi:hypothetical protein
MFPLAHNAGDARREQLDAGVQTLGNPHETV